MPSVSVIMPVYNGEAFLAAAIDSLLNQTFEGRVEIIVIDDGSTDSTPEILKSYGDKIISLHQPNKRSAHARNLGLKHATGDYIAYLDADDIAYPDRLAKQIQCLKANPEAMMVCSAIDYIDEAGKRTGGRLVPPVDFVDLCFANPVPMSSLVHPRNLIDEIGDFDHHSLSWDWDLVVRVAARYPFKILDEPLIGYRLHSQNTSKTRKRLYQNYRQSRHYIVNKIAKQYPHKRTLRIMSGFAWLECQLLGMLFLPDILERVWYKLHAQLPKLTKPVYRFLLNL